MPAADLLARLDATREIDIETQSPTGDIHRVTIWILVLDESVYVASVRGTRGRWWREITREGHGKLVLEGKRIPVKAKRVTDDALRQRFSDAVAKKYRTSKASVIAMQRTGTLETLLRLEL